MTALVVVPFVLPGVTSRAEAREVAEELDKILQLNYVAQLERFGLEQRKGVELPRPLDAVLLAVVT